MQEKEPFKAKSLLFLRQVKLKGGAHCPAKLL